MSLFGRRKLLTRRGKQKSWEIATKAYLSAANELDRQLTTDDAEHVQALAEAEMKSAGIPPIIWQIVLSYIAQLIVNWIIEKYLTPPAFPADMVGDDDDE